MRLRLTAPFLATLTTLALAVSGCSGDDSPKSDPTTSPSASASNYLDVPEGVELTAQGSTLSVGDTATVAYEPRQGQVAALEIKVRSLEKADFDMFVGWELTSAIRKTQPYFVNVTVKNVGDANLAGRTIPLYIVDGDNKLIEPSVFTGTFKPCDGATFPKPFKNGDTTKGCLVYLSPHHGDLTAASFRPTQEFNPITWTGDVTKAKVPSDHKKKSDKKSSGDQKKPGSGGNKKASNKKG